MHIVQLTPGAGAMYCGGCLRDNALVAALRKLGHQVTLLPLYLPLTLDEADESAGSPVFFGGVNVYLEQKSALFRSAPGWLHDLLSSRPLLNWAAGKAAKTRPADLGELTLSMLGGEAGNQVRELELLIAWLKSQPPADAVCLSNALLIGMARRLKSELHIPVVCSLQGEDSFLDGLPETHRAACWQELANRAREVDLFIAPSRYFGDLMRDRLGLAARKVQVVPNGINLHGYCDECRVTSGEGAGSPSRADLDAPTGVRPSSGAATSGVRPIEPLADVAAPGDGRTPAPALPMAAVSRRAPSSPVTRHPSPVLGFFARMCPEKGLDTLVDAYLLLRKRAPAQNLRLSVGGSCGPADRPFVASLWEKLQAAGWMADVSLQPNVDRAGKVEFLRSLSVFSVPARYSEAFGLYVIEALAAGVPVVQPRASAFPELIEATGGGLLCTPEDPQALADAIEELLSNPARAQALGEAGRKAVHQRYGAEGMARAMVEALKELFSGRMPRVADSG